MLAENILLFSKICELSTHCRSALFRWVPKNRQLESVSRSHKYSSSYSHRLGFRCFLHSFAAFIVTSQTIFSVFQTNAQSNGDNTDEGANVMVIQFQNGLAAIVLIALTFHLHTSRRQAVDVILYINGSLQFARKYKSFNKKGDRSILEVLNVLFAYAMYVTAIILPLGFIYGLHWNNPCKPSLAGYWLLEECSTSPDSSAFKRGFSHWRILTKTAVLLFNHYIWQFGYSITIFVVAGIQILCVMSLQKYLRIFCNIVNSKQYSTYDTGSIYRNIQMLAKFANTIQKGTHMSVLIVAAVVIQSVSSTTLVRLTWTFENLPYAVVFSITFVDASLACVVCLGGMAGVYAQSVIVHQKMNAVIFSLIKKGGRRKEERWLRRFFKSCPLIKIRFGGFNYVDKETPLNCINMANALTVQLLLLGL